MWEEEVEHVSSELQKALQSLEAFCSDSQVWYFLGTNNPESKVKAAFYLCKSPKVLGMPLKRWLICELAYRLLLTISTTKCLVS